MAESISSESDDFSAPNQTNPIETSDDLVEMFNQSRNESPVNPLNEDLNSDVEYKLSESTFEKIPSLLDKFDFKIDSETNNNNELITVNNKDDYIDEDLYLAVKPNEIQFEHKHSVSTLTSLLTNNETANNSEPSAKITKPNESIEIKKEEEKIQLKTNEMIEFIIKMSKLKEKKKSEQKYSTLTSTYQTEDYSRKKSHKTDSKNKNIQNHLDSNESAFIWTELEAFMVQHEQTGQSSCGASAIINVLKALNFEIDYERVNSMVQINSRIPESLSSTTTLAQYLFSRSIAGMNATEMIQNIQRVTFNKINGRFFPLSSLQSNRISKWLLHWIRKGAAPVALLNLQKTPMWGKIPDAWHHQMIYAVSSNDVYLTNPLERKPFDTFLRELNSDSSLLVRTEDVIKRFNENPKSLNEFLSIKDHLFIEKKRWFDLNVLGQVVNVLRTPSSATHITIPASYVPGLTLFAKQDSVLYEEILLEK